MASTVRGRVLMRKRESGTTLSATFPYMTIPVRPQTFGEFLELLRYLDEHKLLCERCRSAPANMVNHLHRRCGHCVEVGLNYQEITVGRNPLERRLCALVGEWGQALCGASEGGEADNISEPPTSERRPQELHHRDLGEVWQAAAGTNGCAE